MNWILITALGTVVVATLLVLWQKQGLNQAIKENKMVHLQIRQQIEKIRQELEHYRK